jgi:hypothetical protein
MHQPRRTGARRLAGLVAGLTLVGTMTGSSVAATAKSSFVGDFDLIDSDTGAVVGHIKASTFAPTSQRLVPGSYDFKGAGGVDVQEAHALVADTAFWFDPGNPAPGLGGSNVAFAEGVECQYYGPGATDCHDWAVMFIDDIAPYLPDQVAFARRDPATGDWDFAEWFWVGRGEFTLRLAGG